MCLANSCTCCGCIPIKLGIFLIALFSLITAGLMIYHGVIRSDPVPQNPMTSPDVSTFIYHALRVGIIVVAGIFFFCGLVLPLPLYFCVSLFIVIANILSSAIQATFFLLLGVILACWFTADCVLHGDELYPVVIGTLIGFLLWGYFINVLYNYACDLSQGRGCCQVPCYPWDYVTRASGRFTNCCSLRFLGKRDGLKPSYSTETSAITQCAIPPPSIPQPSLPQYPRRARPTPQCNQNSCGISATDIKETKRRTKQAKIQREESTYFEPCIEEPRRRKSNIRVVSRPSRSRSRVRQKASYSSLGSCSSLNLILVPSTSGPSTSCTSLDSKLRSDTDQEYIDFVCKDKKRKKASSLKFESSCKCKTNKKKKYYNYQVSDITQNQKNTNIYTSIEKLPSSNEPCNMPTVCEVPKTKNPKILCNSSIESESFVVERDNIPEGDSKNMSKVYSVRFKCKQARDLLARKFFQGSRKQNTTEKFEGNYSTMQAKSSSELDSVSDAKCRPVLEAKQLPCTAGTESDEETVNRRNRRGSETDDEMTTEKSNKREKKPYSSQNCGKPLSRDASTDSHDLGVCPPRDTDQSSFCSANDSNQWDSDQNGSQQKLKPYKQKKDECSKQENDISNTNSEDSMTKDTSYKQVCKKNKAKEKRKSKSTSEESNNDSSDNTNTNAEKQDENKVELVTQKPGNNHNEKEKTPTDSRRSSCESPRQDKRDSLARGQDKRDSVARGQEKRESLAREQERRESLAREQERCESLAKGQEKRESLARGQERRESLARGQERRESLARGQEKRESLSRGQDKRESLARGQDRRESLARGQDRRESLAREQEKRESLVRGQDRRDTLTRGQDGPCDNPAKVQDRPRTPSRLKERRHVTTARVQERPHVTTARVQERPYDTPTRAKERHYDTTARITQKPINDCSMREDYCNDSSEYSMSKLESRNSESEAECDKIVKKLICKPKKQKEKTKTKTKNKDKCKNMKCKKGNCIRISSQDSLRRRSSGSSSGSHNMGRHGGRLSSDYSEYENDKNNKYKEICIKNLADPDCGFQDTKQKKHKERKERKERKEHKQHKEHKDNKRSNKCNDPCIEINIKSDNENCPVNLKPGKHRSDSKIRIVVGSSSNESLNTKKRIYRKHKHEDEEGSSADSEIYNRRISKARAQRRHEDHHTKPSHQESVRASSRNYTDSS